MRSMQRIFRLRLLLVAPASFLLLVAAGCLILPKKGPEPFPDPALQFLEAGGAGRADVLHQLGEPDWRFDDYRVFVYEGAQHLGTMIYGSLPATVSPMLKREVLFIAFDAEGRVAGHAVQKPSPLERALGLGRHSIHQRVQDWSAEQQLERVDLGFAVPPKRSGIVFYRTQRFWDTGSMDADVSVDGVPIGQVEEGTYLPIVVEPGRYDLHLLVRNFYRRAPTGSKSVDAAVTVKLDETAYMLLEIRHGSGPFRVKVERRPELEARDKLGELALVSPPPAYAGW